MEDKRSSSKTFPSFLPMVSGGDCMRGGCVQSPIKRKNTGFPCRAAASIRNGSSVPGHLPVQAARVSEDAREFQAGCAGWNCAGSKSAALNRRFQSKAGGALELAAEELTELPVLAADA